MSVALVLFGAIAFLRLPVREFPDVDPPVVSVSTFLQGANPRVMESAVTDILEEELSTIPGLRTLTRTTARVELIRQEARLKVARYQLGRRVGLSGPVDAASLDTLAAPGLPISEEQAMAEAVRESPDAVLARANERAAAAQFRAARGSYLPRIDLFGQFSAFDDRFFPAATTRSAFGLSLSWPIWDNAARELNVARATTARDVSRAVRNDTELALQRDVVEAYEAYNAARAAADLAANAVTVAGENLRVQQQRYQAGATTIIDLITAQVSLSEAEAGLVQARQGTRLALSGLEAILGRRLFQY